jgi:hypothetical protein
VEPDFIPTEARMEDLVRDAADRVADLEGAWEKSR